MPAAILARLALLEARRGGFIALGGLIALIFAVPTLLWSSPLAAACWAVSLACELALVAAAALFFAMTLAQLVPALAATVGLYFLARSMGAMQAIAASPLTEDSF